MTEVITPYPKRSCAGQMPIWYPWAHRIRTEIQSPTSTQCLKDFRTISRSERQTVHLLNSPELDNVDLVKGPRRSRSSYSYCNIDVEKQGTPSIIQCLPTPVASIV